MRVLFEWYCSIASNLTGINTCSIGSYILLVSAFHCKILIVGIHPETTTRIQNGGLIIASDNECCQTCINSFAIA